MITLTDAKTWLRIDDTSQDDRIQMIVDGVNQAARTYCGRQFDYGTYTENVHFENGYAILKETPIESITSVGPIDETDIAEYTYLDDGQIWIEPKLTGYSTVVYTGGYASIPSDLKLALLRWVEYFYSKPEGVTRQAFESLSVNFEGPSDVLAILNTYKVRRFL